MNAVLPSLTVFALFAVATTLAETVYVGDQGFAGLHADKSIDSPIINIIHTNTALEIIQRGEKMSYVRGPEGNTGWVDNNYVTQHADQKAEITKLQSAHSKITQLQGAATKASENATMAQLQDENKTLQEKLKAERLKVGGLNVELATLRKRIGRSNDSGSLHLELERLEEENKALRIQLAKAMNPAGSEEDRPSAVKPPARDNTLIYVALALLAGIGFGLYMMSRFVRRRHGGFRI